MKRNIYLNPLDFQEALERLAAEFRGVQARRLETVPVTEALGRISAAPVMARLSNPNHNAAAMDGICVSSAATAGADPRSPLRLKAPEEFSYIDTGDPVPEGRDAVIMIEDLIEADEASAVLTAPAYPWQHIRPVGEDVVAGEMILPSSPRSAPSIWEPSSPGESPRWRS